MSAHVIHCYEYVNRPFERISEALTLGAVGIFQRATTSAVARATSLTSKMKVTLAGLEIGKNVIIKVTHVDRKTTAPRLADEAIELELQWEAETNAALFPAMHATLRAYPLSSEETQLELTGTYDPPGGVLGEVADRVFGHRVAQATAHRFLEDVASRLSEELA